MFEVSRYGGGAAGVLVKLRRGECVKAEPVRCACVHACMHAHKHRKAKGSTNHPLLVCSNPMRTHTVK